MRDPFDVAQSSRGRFYVFIFVFIPLPILSVPSSLSIDSFRSKSLTNLRMTSINAGEDEAVVHRAALTDDTPTSSPQPEGTQTQTEVAPTRKEEKGNILLRTVAHSTGSSSAAPGTSSAPSLAPASTELELDNYILQTPSAMAPHFATAEGFDVEYHYTGRAIRSAVQRKSSFPGGESGEAHSSASGGPSAIQVEVLPHGKGRLQLFRVDRKKATGATTVPTGASQSSPQQSPRPTMVENASMSSNPEASASPTDSEVAKPLEDEYVRTLLISFEGEFVHGKRHGVGSLTVISKYTLSCVWSNDVPELSGECQLVTLEQGKDKASCYQGLLSVISDVNAAATREGFSGLEWVFHVRILPDGAGEMQYADRKRYCGQWQCGERNGFGILVDPNLNTTFIGAFEYDLKNGSGTLFKEQSGATFCGQWVDDQLSGPGGLHLKGNAFTIQGNGWNPMVSDCESAVIIKSRNVNGVWEPLFINFDNNLAMALGENSPNGVVRSFNVGAGKDPNAEATPQTVIHAMDSLLNRSDFASLLATFQRCFYFLYGSCGSALEIGGGPTERTQRGAAASISTASPTASTKNLLSWCSMTSPFSCIHKTTRRRAIDETILTRATEDMASFIFSVRLRLQSFVATQPRLCDFDIGGGVLRLAWDRVHALVAPVMHNIFAAIYHHSDIAHHLAMRRTESKLCLKDFLPDSDDSLEEYLIEKVVGPLLTISDNDEQTTGDGLAEAPAGGVSNITIIGTPQGVKVSFPLHKVRCSPEQQFLALRKAVYAAGRLCGASITAEDEANGLGDSAIHTFLQTEANQYNFCRILQYAALQCLDQTLYSKLRYLDMVTVGVEPKYPTPCEHEDPSATSQIPTPRTNTDLYCLHTMLQAVISSSTVYPALRDMTRAVHDPSIPKAELPILPLSEIFAEVRHVLGFGLLDSISQGAAENAEKGRSESPAAAPDSSGPRTSSQDIDVEHFSAEGGVEFASPSFYFTRSEAIFQANATPSRLQSGSGGGLQGQQTQSGSVSANPVNNTSFASEVSFHDQMDQAIDGDFSLEPFVTHMLRTVDTYLQLVANGEEGMSFGGKRLVAEPVGVSVAGGSSPKTGNLSPRGLRSPAMIPTPLSPSSRTYTYRPADTKSYKYLKTRQAASQLKMVRDLLYRIGINFRILEDRGSVMVPLDSGLTSREISTYSGGGSEVRDDSIGRGATVSDASPSLPTKRQHTFSSAELEDGSIKMILQPIHLDSHSHDPRRSPDPNVASGAFTASASSSFPNATGISGAEFHCPLFVLQKLSAEWSHDLYTVEHLSRARRRN